LYFYAIPGNFGRIFCSAKNRAIRSNKNAFVSKAGVWGSAPNSENKNAQAFLFRSYPLREPKTH
jgi:hypothetical protein